MFKKGILLELPKILFISWILFYIIEYSNALPLTDEETENGTEEDLHHRKITFNVIAFPDKKSDNVKVNVQGEEFKMIENEFPLFSLTIDTFPLVNGNMTMDIKYYYIVDDKKEDFKRTLPAAYEKTYNDFFGRKQTLYNIPPLKDSSSKPWSRSIGPTTVFDPSYIPTIYFHNTRSFFTNGPKRDVIKKITFIFKDEVVSLTNVDVSTKNRTWKKFQIKMVLFNNNNIHSRTVFKLRPSFEDPLFFRQILYTDLLTAVGNPVHQSVSARVYGSGDSNYRDSIPIGLYVLQEDTTSWNFIKTAFYGDPETEKAQFPSVGYGIPLDGSTGSDFFWNEKSKNSLSQYSNFIYPEGFSNERIRSLSKALNSLNVKDKKEVEKFSKEWLDLPTFINALVLEYLAGHWDSYWMYTSNFVMYDDPLTTLSNTTYHFYFIDQDFDMTFGVGLSDRINSWGEDFPKKSYRKLVNREWNVAGKNRVAIDKLLSQGVTRDMFETRLKTIVKNIFNPQVLFPLIDAYVERLRPEMKWNYEIAMAKNPFSNSKAKKCKFTIDDFDTNVNRGGKYNYWGLKEWIKLRAETVADEFHFKWSS